MFLIGRVGEQSIKRAAGTPVALFHSERAEKVLKRRVFKGFVWMFFFVMASGRIMLRNA
jgi:hypothetical protein